MRTSLKTRIASVTAAAAIATTGAMAAAGVADAGTVHHRLHTNLSIGASRAVVDHHRGAEIHGFLSSHRTDLAGKRVWLDRRLQGGKWVLLRSQLSNRHGLVRFFVLPPRNAKFKLVFRGTVNFAPSQSLAVVFLRKA